MDGDNRQLTVKAVKQTDPKSQLKRNRKEKKQPLKVVYISNPLKVTLEVSEFKKKVQELTGRHSDVADIMFQKAVVTVAQLEEEEEGGKGGGEEMPLTPMASADVQGSTSTMSSSGASDPSKDDFMPFDPYYNIGTPFTDLYYDGGFRHLDLI